MKLWGMAARFDTYESVIRAASEASRSGYTSLDGYAPFPSTELTEALGTPKDRVPLISLTGGVLGGLIGYGMQWYSNVIDYPINVGNRPYQSWPSFVPVTFELTVLGAALFCAFGMLLLNGLPRLYHPLFLLEEFRTRASTDAFYLCIRAEDPKFDPDEIRSFLLGLGALSVSEVPRDPYEEKAG